MTDWPRVIAFINSAGASELARRREDNLSRAEYAALGLIYGGALALALILLWVLR